MSRAAPLLFHETQSFRLQRVRLMVAILPAAMSLLLIWQVILGHPWGKQPMSNGNIIGWTVFLWLVYLRLMTVRLVTDVSPAELRVTMRGLWRQRHIVRSDIKTAEIVTFDAARDWGGYGLRNTRRGAAYIADGDRGVMLKLVKGGAILIGSARPEELRSALSVPTAE
jgi:hypothetical protein